MKKKRKKGSWKFKFCCLPIVIFFLSALIFGVVVVAKIGVWQIPIASKIFYTLPTPSRIVVVNNPASVAASQLNVRPDESNGAATLSISEQQLTFLIRQSLTGKSSSVFAPSLQAVINPDNIEFFGLMVKPAALNVKLKILPFVENNKFKFRIVEATIGNLSLPAVLARWFIDKYLPLPLASISNMYPQLPLRDIKLEHGQLNFIFSLNNSQ
ncbi:MAG: hypothetical protein PHW95_00525 [Patescibacteria group bacterium]|nr:hypothetical protein [Patescibacteria group bacterium]